ncbi:hypothetical protein [Herbaspirillum robiniae]|uniref:hypothetical protein n=1 Tax=Herbaspirillum robiniae TaxID=2014887 RepID=UPI0009A2298B|nr:hypothetical protein [Herbaspirillum robiniae]
MAVNQFLTFGVAGGANVIDQVTYSGLAARGSGFQAGTALSAQLNKVWRQSSIMAAVIGQLIADKSGQDAIDDGTTATLLANLQTAIQSVVAPTFSAVQGTRKNLKIAAIGVNNTNVVVTVDELMLETAGGLYKTVKNLNLTINSAGTVGQPLSLSTGVLAASTFYHVWVWHNGTTTTATIDPSATAPTAPAGYTNGYRARVGAVVTDSSGNKYLMQTLQVDNVAQYVPLLSSNTASAPVAQSGTVGTINSSLVSSSLVGLIPSTSTRADFGVAIASSGSAQISSSSVPAITGGAGITFQSAPGNMNMRQWLTLESMNVYVASVGSANRVTINGWEDAL